MGDGGGAQANGGEGDKLTVTAQIANIISGTLPGVGETPVLARWLQSSPRGASFSLSHVGS